MHDRTLSLAQDAGILLHMFDGWERPHSRWSPADNGPGATEMSASLIFAGQQTSGRSIRSAIYSGSAGLIFRPGAAKLLCAKPVDSAGTCGRDPPCPHRADPALPWTELDDKFCTWPPEDIGVQLRRMTAWQQQWNRMWYNEVRTSAEPAWSVGPASRF